MKESKTKENYYKRSKNRLLSNSFGLISILVFFLIFLIVFIPNFNNYYISTKNISELKNLWEQKRYLELINLSEKMLSQNPINKDALYYGGVACFYYSFEIPDEFSDKKKQYRTNSLKKLRLFKVLDIKRDPKNLSQIDYVLGLIYYYEGIMFNDLAKRYLFEFLRLNPQHDEVLIYLGLLKSSSEDLSEIKEGNRYFLKLLSKPNLSYKDLIYIEVVKNYLKLKDFEKAESYINAFFDSNPPTEYLEQAYFLKAKILISEGKIDSAFQEYDKLLKVNEKSSDGHYYRGELYEKTGKIAQARYEYREALRIDPTNKKAKEKLNN